MKNKQTIKINVPLSSIHGENFREEMSEVRRKGGQHLTEVLSSHQGLSEEASLLDSIIDMATDPDIEEVKGNPGEYAEFSVNQSGEVGDIHFVTVLPVDKRRILEQARSLATQPYGPSYGPYRGGTYYSDKRKRQHPTIGPVGTSVDKVLPKL